jgi:hypothetical protein
MEFIMKYRVSFVLALLMSAVFTIQVQAQEEWVWDEYGIGFTLSKGMKVTQNDGETFTAERDNLFLTITPIKDEEITEGDLAMAVFTMAKEMEYDGIEDADKLELDDLVGYYVEGTKDGAGAFVIALLDQESESNYLVIIVFDDDSRDEAIEMAQSMYAYDGK